MNIWIFINKEDILYDVINARIPYEDSCRLKRLLKNVGFPGENPCNPYEENIYVGLPYEDPWRIKSLLINIGLEGKDHFLPTRGIYMLDFYFNTLAGLKGYLKMHDFLANIFAATQDKYTCYTSRRRSLLPHMENTNSRLPTKDLCLPIRLIYGMNF